MDAIYKRRSIRRFTPEKVPEEAVMDFIKAGMNAPSAANQQPWRFVIIDDRRLLNEIPSFHQYAQMLKEAPVAILVCGDMDLSKHGGFWIQDCSAAVENMLLEIADRGYGGVWLGVYPRDERVEGMRKLLRLPEKIVPFALIALGRPAEEKPRKNEFDAERISHNTWR
jgi:nitroreductase